MIRAVIDLMITDAMHSRANLQKVGAASWPLAAGNFFIERVSSILFSLFLFTFLIARGQKASIISLSIYIVYYYISYTIRNIIKLIKRRDIDKREKKKRNSILAGLLGGLLGGLL